MACLFHHLMPFSRDDLCDTKFLGCTNVRWFLSEAKWSILLLRCVVSHYPVDQITRFQEKNFIQRHSYIWQLWLQTAVKTTDLYFSGFPLKLSISKIRSNTDLSTNKLLLCLLKNNK